MDLSPFSKISAELRNQIYELVLVHEIPIIITADDYSSDLRTTSLLPGSHAIALLRTCKQISNESTALFYGNNTFRFQFLRPVRCHPIFGRSRTYLNASGTVCFHSPLVLSTDYMDEVCLVQRFCASIGDRALVGLRKLHILARRDLSRWYLHVCQTHSRSLLGLRGISARNDELSIKYTIDDVEERNGLIIGRATATFHIADLEASLESAIASLEAYARDHMVMSVKSSIGELCAELKRFQKIGLVSK